MHVVRLKSVKLYIRSTVGEVITHHDMLLLKARVSHVDSSDITTEWKYFFL